MHNHLQVLPPGSDQPLSETLDRLDNAIDEIYQRLNTGLAVLNAGDNRTCSCYTNYGHALEIVIRDCMAMIYPTSDEEGMSSRLTKLQEALSDGEGAKGGVQ